MSRPRNDIDRGALAQIAARARAYGPTRLARDSGLSRAAIYEGLAADGNPRLSTLLAASGALGLKLTVVSL